MGLQPKMRKPRAQPCEPAWGPTRSSDSLFGGSVLETSRVLSNTTAAVRLRYSFTEGKSHLGPSNMDINVNLGLL